MTVLAETRRLRRLFGGLLLAATPLSFAQACSSDPSAPSANDGGGAPDAVDAPNALDQSAPFDAACSVVTEQLDAAPDVDPPCRYTLPCGPTPDVGFVIRGCAIERADVTDGGDASLGCAIPAEYGCANDAYAPPASGSLTFRCNDCLGGSGRRPNGLLRSTRAASHTRLGAYFSRMAEAEAASVHAFERMHEELVHFRAPRALVAATARSIQDERRHARTTARAARREGDVVAVPRVRRARMRSLEAMACENATEGCVRETYGALLLAWRAEHAQMHRSLFGRLAADEARHAALSWSVAQWLETRLDARERARVRHAMRSALTDLATELRTQPLDPPELGTPDRPTALRLLDGLAEALLPRRAARGPARMWPPA